MKKRKFDQWLVHDASGFYAESILCPTKRWADEVRQDQTDKYTDGKWCVAKVDVRLARRGKRR